MQRPHLIRSVQDQPFVEFDDESDHFLVLLWIISTKLCDLKTVQSGLSNSVAAVVLDKPESEEEPKPKYFWGSPAWIWTTNLVQVRDKKGLPILAQCQSLDYYHFQFAKKTWVYVPPIPLMLWELYCAEFNIPASCEED